MTEQEEPTTVRHLTHFAHELDYRRRCGARGHVRVEVRLVEHVVERLLHHAAVVHNAVRRSRRALELRSN